ncbi:hypothetical protein BH11MYX4_BH11MYX4_03790 [soil metagenome]
MGARSSLEAPSLPHLTAFRALLAAGRSTQAMVYQTSHRRALEREIELEEQTAGTDVAGEVEREQKELARLAKVAPELAAYRTLVAEGKRVQASIYLSANALAVRVQEATEEADVEARRVAREAEVRAGASGAQ